MSRTGVPGPDDSDAIADFEPLPMAGTPGVVETPDGPVVPKSPDDRNLPPLASSPKGDVAAAPAGESARLGMAMVAVFSLVLAVLGVLILVGVIALPTWSGILFVSLGLAGLLLMGLPKVVGSVPGTRTDAAPHAAEQGKDR